MWLQVSIIMFFPLLRYSTGDIGIRSNNYCKCQRNYPLISEVEGREQDYIVDAKQNKIPLAPAIFNYNDMDWIGVEEFKVLQKKLQAKLLLIFKKRMNFPEII